MGKPVAIVFGVGAEQGLGAALCRRFARGGHHVLVAGRTPAKIEQVVGTIRPAGGNAEAARHRRPREADVIAAFDRAMAPGPGLEPVDLVAYNAGNNKRIDLRELSARIVRGFLARRLFRRLPGGTRSGATAGAAGSRHGAVHRRLRQPARQARICAFRRREGRLADARAKHGARVRAAGHSCRACGD